MRGEREQINDIRALAESFGVAFELDHTSKGRVRVVFRAGTQKTAVVMAKGHGGDLHGRQNNLTRIRRQLREITGRTR